MQPADADVRVEDLAAHICDQLGPDLTDFLVVVLHGLERIKEELRNRDLRKTRRALEAIPGLDGSYSRDDGDRDARGADSLHPVNEKIDVVKHLRENKADASIDLLLEPLHLILELFLGKCHVLWEAGDRDVEVVVVLAADVFDEVNAVHEAAVDGLPLVLSLGRIAS